jgi:hypothetical protein
MMMSSLKMKPQKMKVKQSNNLEQLNQKKRRLINMTKKRKKIWIH